MDHIDFTVGKEKGFFAFMGKVNSRGRIALISHNDLDGIASAKVANEVLHADFIRFIDYVDLNEVLVEELRGNRVTRVIFTDLSIESPEVIRKIERFADILIIDHHPPKADLNSRHTVYLNAQGYCSSYLCYYLFFKVQDISYLDWIVASACLSDWLYLNSERWLKETYKRYKVAFSNDPEKIKKGKIWDLQMNLSLFLIYFKDNIDKAYYLIGQHMEDVDSLKVYSQEVFNEITQSLRLFEKEKTKIRGGYFWELHSRFPIKELVLNILCARNKETTFIIAERRGNFYRFSARRLDGKISAADILRVLTQGFVGASAGGHKSAAGGHVMLQDADKFIEQIKKF